MLANFCCRDTWRVCGCVCGVHSVCPHNESGSVKAIVAIDEEGNSKEFSYEQLVLPDYSYIEMRQMLEFLFKVIPRLVGDERVEGEYSEAIQTWVAARDEHKF